MIKWTAFILRYLYDMEMRLIIVHGFMNNVYHNSSCMITIDHCHERLLIMYHNCWSLPWKTVDHTWSLMCIIVDHVSQLLIMSMKHRWSYVINIDHCHESLLIMYHNCWSCIISWSLTFDHGHCFPNYRKTWKFFAALTGKGLFSKKETTPLDQEATGHSCALLSS